MRPKDRRPCAATNGGRRDVSDEDAQQRAAQRPPRPADLAECEQQIEAQAARIVELMRQNAELAAIAYELGAILRRAAILAGEQAKFDDEHFPKCEAG